MINYFNFKKFNDEYLLTNDLGRYIFLKPSQMYELLLKSKTGDEDVDNRLIKNSFIYSESNEAFSEAQIGHIFNAKSYLFSPTQLHIFVVTTACNHKCVYCQAQNGKDNLNGYMDIDTAERAVDIALQTPVDNLQFEFQGGEPLLNFEIIKHIVQYSIKKANGKNIKFSIVSNLTLLNDEMIDFISEYNIEISTSLDGNEKIHNLNRPYKNGNNSYNDVICAIKRLQNKNIRVGAILTISKNSFKYIKEIVDEYVCLNLNSISLRPLTPLGSANYNWDKIGYSVQEFVVFYKEALNYIIEYNLNGTNLAEGIATVFLKKIIEGIGMNHMEYRSPCGASIGQIAYYYDGNIFTCDEGRMIYEMGNDSFKLGNVYTDDYDSLLNTRKCKGVCSSSILESLPSCSDCVYQPYCGICPVINYMLYGDIYEKYPNNYKCKINKGILDTIFQKLQEDDYNIRQVFRSWL